MVKERRKRICQKKDESESVCVSDDSGDELKVKFADIASPCFDRTGSVQAVLHTQALWLQSAAGGEQIWLRYLVRCHGEFGTPVLNTLGKLEPPSKIR